MLSTKGHLQICICILDAHSPTQVCPTLPTPSGRFLPANRQQTAAKPAATPQATPFSPPNTLAPNLTSTTKYAIHHTSQPAGTIAIYTKGITTRLSGFAIRPIPQIIAIKLIANQEAQTRMFHQPTDILTRLRSHTEILRNTTAIASQGGFTVDHRTPVLIRKRDGGTWPTGIVSHQLQLQLPTQTSEPHTATPIDISDNQRVLTLDFSDHKNEILDHGDIQIVPFDGAPSQASRIFDLVSGRSSTFHQRLVDALTRPESLDAIARHANRKATNQQSRSNAAKELAVSTPDFALIQCPPGTDHPTFLCEIVTKLLETPNRILLACPKGAPIDNTLAHLGNRKATTIRIGARGNVSPASQRFALANSSQSVSNNLIKLLTPVSDTAGDVESVQRNFANTVANDREAHSLVLRNADLVCTTIAGFASTPDFCDITPQFDVLVLYDAHKVSIADFVLIASQAKKWILIGDHRQLSPEIDPNAIESAVSICLTQSGFPTPDIAWTREISKQLRQHFNHRMHTDPNRVSNAWHDLVDEISRYFDVDNATFESMVRLGADATKWTQAYRAAVDEAPGERAETSITNPATSSVLRLGSELLNLQSIALPSAFEHLCRLPKDRMVSLNIQTRMEPKLAEFASELVYSNDYKSAPSTSKLGLDIPGLKEPAIWIDTATMPASSRNEHPRNREWLGGDYTNPLEVDIAVEIIQLCATWAERNWNGNSLIENGDEMASFNIGITCFFPRQAIAIFDALIPSLRADSTDPYSCSGRWPIPSANGTPTLIRIDVVDQLQSAADDITIICTTRSNPKGLRGVVDSLEKLSFAATRARHKRIVIGDSSTLAGQAGGIRRHQADPLLRLFQTSEVKKKWGRALGVRP